MKYNLSPASSWNKPTFRQLRLTAMEWSLLLATILVLFITSLDALDGSQVGKGSALELAKKQGQQDYLAQRTK